MCYRYFQNEIETHLKEYHETLLRTQFANYQHIFTDKNIPKADIRREPDETKLNSFDILNKYFEKTDSSFKNLFNIKVVYKKDSQSRIVFCMPVIKIKMNFSLLFV